MDYAIDTNYLRKPELEAALLSSAPSDRFILADTAVLETMKNAQWELTARRSFEIASRYPSKFFTATEPSKLMNEELDSGRDTTEVVDPGLTGNFRALLVEIASGSDGVAMSNTRNVILAAQTLLCTQQQNHQQNLCELKAICDAVKADVNLKVYHNLADDTLKRQFRLRFAKTSALMSIGQTAVEEHKGQNIGNDLATGRGIILRHAIGTNLLGFKWAINHGLDCLPAWKATNEQMDLDHAVIATYCDGILTTESSVAQMRQDILDALNVESFQFPNEQPTADPETTA